MNHMEYKTLALHKRLLRDLTNVTITKLLMEMMNLWVHHTASILKTYISWSTPAAKKQPTQSTETKCPKISFPLSCLTEWSIVLSSNNTCLMYPTFLEQILQICKTNDQFLFHRPSIPQTLIGVDQTPPPTQL